MDMELTLRRCGPEDAHALSALASRTFSETFTGTCTEKDMAGFLAQVYSPQKLAAELADPAEQIFFAELDGTPAGYVQFTESTPDFPFEEGLRPLELKRLYVDAAWKGRGIAQRLMDHYTAWAANYEFRYLWLGVWEENFRAQAFYRKYGFAFTGYRHPFPIGSTPQTDEWWAKIIPV